MKREVNVNRRLQFTLLHTALALTAAVTQPSCGAQSQDGSGSTTHFLKRCGSDGSCGEGLRCWCGVCTRRCEADRECQQHDEAAQCEAPWLLSASCESPADLCQLPLDSEVDAREDGNVSVSPEILGDTIETSNTSNAEPSVNPEPDITLMRPPIPPLDCSQPEVLVDGESGEATEAYTWDGQKCVRFIDTTNSARYFTEAACEVGYVACNKDLLVRQLNSVDDYDQSSYQVGFSSAVADPLTMYLEWTEAEWLGWEGSEVITDCPRTPQQEFCATNRTLTLQTSEQAVMLAVTHPWRKPNDHYFQPQRVKFRQRVWDFQYAFEVVDAADETPVFFVVHNFSDQLSWKLGNFQAHQGYPIAHSPDDASDCLIESVWTSTLVSFYFEDSESSVKRAFPTLDEVELVPFQSTELADPNTGQTFDISVGNSNTMVTTPTAPDCGKAAVHQELFVHRLQ